MHASVPPCRARKRGQESRRRFGARTCGVPPHRVPHHLELLHEAEEEARPDERHDGADDVQRRKEGDLAQGEEDAAEQGQPEAGDEAQAKAVQALLLCELEELEGRLVLSEKGGGEGSARVGLESNLTGREERP